MTEILDRCPDCSAAVNITTRSLVHEATCPLGLAIDRVVDTDRHWFETHPEQGSRIRAASWAERAEFGLVSGGLTVPGAQLQVVVRRLPGGRSRQFRWVPGSAPAEKGRC